MMLNLCLTVYLNGETNDPEHLLTINAVISNSLLHREYCKDYLENFTEKTWCKMLI